MVTTYSHESMLRDETISCPFVLNRTVRNQRVEPSATFPVSLSFSLAQITRPTGEPGECFWIREFVTLRRRRRCNAAFQHVLGDVESRGNLLPPTEGWFLFHPPSRDGNEKMRPSSDSRSSCPVMVWDSPCGDLVSFPTEP